MTNNIHIIKHGDIPAFVVLPYEDYRKLISNKPISDEMVYSLAKTKEEEYFPEEVVKDILNGRNPIKVFREYRKLTQERLAQKIGMSKQYISGLESGSKKGSASTLKKIADALQVDLEDLL